MKKTLFILIALILVLFAFSSCEKRYSEKYWGRVFRNMYQYVDYFTINAACNTSAKQFVPRTREELLELVEPLFEFRRGQLDYRPILLKISPDLTYSEIDTAVEILIETPLDGIVAVAGSTELMHRFVRTEKPERK